MTDAKNTDQVIETLGVIEYNVTDATIEQWRQEYMGLTIAGEDDKTGLARVHEARMVVKRKRVEVEDKRKALKAEALTYERAVDKEAKRIFALIEPIETHLSNEELRITNLKAERESAEKARVASIQEKLQAVANMRYVEPTVKADVLERKIEAVLGFLDPETFDFKEFNAQVQIVIAETVDMLKKSLVKRRKFEKDQADMEAERSRIAAENARIEAENKRLADERAALDAEKKAKKEEEDRKTREAEIAEKARKDGLREAQEKAEREIREKKERDEAEAKAKAAAEAKKSDKDRLIAWANSVTTPDVEFNSDEARTIHQEALTDFRKILNRVIRKAAAL